MYLYARNYQQKIPCSCPKHDNHSDCNSYMQCLDDQWQHGSHACYFECECPDTRMVKRATRA